MTFELKLQTGQRVVWDGDDGEDASRDYEASHPGTAVLAWRHPRTQLVIGIQPIQEPRPGWGGPW